ncbi:MAG TPA: hypothetical protein VFG09_06705 [Thermodesulfovibrionales bacterium]|jgi:hypothetical protein|nr:hypothetical protein [Thermodesulfovibrionales bacterium]
MKVRSVFSLVVLSLFILGCGKKGPPTLKAFEKPVPPSGLTAVHREDAVILSWSYPDDMRQKLKGFPILRSANNGFEKIAFVSNDSGSYHDRNFKVDGTYRYKVVAESLKEVLGNDSDAITVTPKSPPPPPGHVRFGVKSDFIEFSWDGSGKDVCYNMYRSFEKRTYGATPLNTEPLCGLSFRDTLLSPEKSVYYQVRALLNTKILDEGYPSPEIEVGPSDFVPSPPSDLRIVRDEDKIFLIWRESPEWWIKGYRVYRKREGDPGFTQMGEVKTPTFTDIERTGRKIRYMIRAVGPVSESAPLEGE